MQLVGWGYEGGGSRCALKGVGAGAVQEASYGKGDCNF